MRFAVFALTLAACHSAPPPVTPAPGFVSQSQRESACLDLQDHIVDLYAEQNRRDFAYELRNPLEVRAWRDGYARELAKTGAFVRFEESCFPSLTPHKYECGMAAKDTETLTACMRLER
jgi:hypothetical protein